MELLFPPGARTSLKSGETAQATGVRSNGALLVAGSSDLQPSGTTLSFSALSTANGPSCSPVGAQNVVVILYYCPGATIDPAITTTTAYSAIFGASPPSLNSYWQEASYGKTSATGAVFGPYILTSTECATIPPLDAAGYAVRDGANFNLDNTRPLYIQNPNSQWMFPGPYAHINACGGVSALGSCNAWTNVVMGCLGGMAHELGHSLGLMHANAREFQAQPLGPLGSTGTITEYADAYDAMGSADAVQYDAPHKASLNWLQGGVDYSTVTTGGTYTILPLESSSPGTKALRISRGSGSNAWLWVEFRQPLGSYDSYCSPTGFIGGYGNIPICSAFNGAMIHYDDGIGTFQSTVESISGESATNLLDFTWGYPSQQVVTLPMGGTWVDPYSNLWITVISTSSSGLTMTVNYGSAPCVRMPPGITSPPGACSTACGALNATSAWYVTPYTGMAPGGSVSFPITFRDNDSPACTAVSASVNPAIPILPTGWSASVTPTTTFSLSPNQLASSTVTVSVPLIAGAAPGAANPATYLMKNTVSDAFTSSLLETTVAVSSRPPSSDSTPPTGAITSPIPASISGIFTITGTAADNVGLNGVGVAIDNSPWALATTTNGWNNWSFAVNTGGLTSGVHRLTVGIYDTSGNLDVLGVSVNIANGPDTTPPTVAIISPSSGTTVSGSITISGTAADNVAVANVQVAVDTGPYSPAAGTSFWSFSLNTTSLSNAPHLITAKATDAAGNTATTATSVTVSNGGSIAAPTKPGNLVLQ